VPIVKGASVEVRVIPKADPSWHPIALAWFRSLGVSGQSQFYEASDWASAVWIAEAMTRGLNSTKGFSAVLFAAVNAAMTELLTTEGSRRRARIELEKGLPAEPVGASIMKKYAGTLSGKLNGIPARN
jgi:hypothetical protein